ncbi:hypothetical protein [Burkholderia vietnamiensis]|uniref:hypothetical protein n=1 Tax=Burkholderia vietnamiensis TaxID=60552 RepID=UPI0009BDA66E|nr:hypothetical protein [Burkholderia vietnamiensis]
MKPPINALLALALAVVPALASAKVQGTGIAIADVTLERVRVEREDHAIDDARRAAERRMSTTSPYGKGAPSLDAAKAMQR